MAGTGFDSASHGATTINVTAAQTTTPQPPTAAINAPADGRMVKLRSLVGTSFSCIEGSNGPGITSCVDSGGASGGRGHLLTQRLGVHTYKVMAASGDGQTGVASIQYTVSRTGSATRSIVNLPARVLNAAVQPCALIACSGNQGPHDHLTNTLGGYCQQYDCRSPMDLVPSNGLDPNLFPFNPDWTSYLTHHQPPFSLEACGQYIHSQFDTHFPRCTSQPVGLDQASGFAGEVCTLGRDPREAFHGHVNYEPATYEGSLYFFEKSPPGADDEYSLDLVPSNPDGVTHYNNAARRPKRRSRMRSTSSLTRTRRSTTTTTTHGGRASIPTSTTTFRSGPSMAIGPKSQALRESTLCARRRPSFTPCMRSRSRPTGARPGHSRVRISGHSSCATSATRATAVRMSTTYRLPRSRCASPGLPARPA